MVNHGTIFETGRLFLRSWSINDVDTAFEMWGDARVMKFVGPPIRTVLDARAWLEWAIAYEKKNQFCRWAVVEKSSLQVVGACGFLYQNEDREVDLGYYFVPSRWGRGYATEISTACVRYAFDILGLTEIVATADINNHKSQRVLDKCGFRFRKTVANEDGTMDRLYFVSNDSE